MKGRINKILTFFVVIGLMASMIILKDIVPMQISKNVQTIEAQDELAAEPETDPLKSHLRRYASNIGRELGPNYNKYFENKWLFYDNQGKYTNMYCIQSGSTVAAKYDVYDLYNIDSTKRDTYFGNEANYKNFMWILEHMYLVDLNEKERGKMFDQILELFPVNEREQVTQWYNGMISEVDAAYRSTGLTTDGTNVEYTNIYDRTYVDDNNAQPTGETYTTNGRDNLIKMVQNHFFLSYTNQRYSGSPAGALLNDENHLVNKLAYGIDKHPYTLFDQNSNTVKFIEAYIKALRDGYNKNDYKIEKFRNFNQEDTRITYDSSTKLDFNTKKIGPFRRYNPYGFKISIEAKDVVYINPLTSIDTVDENGQHVDLSSKTQDSNGEVFYIKVNDNIQQTETAAVTVNWTIKYDGITTAQILIPATSAIEPQVLINVSRRNEETTLGWQGKVEGTADIALKKYIYSVNDVNVPERLGNINLTTIPTTHNAEYNMNKTPVSVKAGDKVVYAIRLFNEGNVAGTASKITDHLPNYLTFNRAFYMNNGQQVDITDISGDKQNIIITNPYSTNLAAYSQGMTEEQFKQNSQIIYVECTVEAPVNQDVYTNMAEISGYRFYGGANDMDSDPSNWSIGTIDRSDPRWIEYTNGKDQSWLDDGMHPFGGQEDDDDFDKIIVEYMDVALTKRIESYITNKNDPSQPEAPLVPEDGSILASKQVVNISGYSDVISGDNNTLTYTMNKKVATVSRGDRIVTVLTVYNEGPVDAVIKEITDYAPYGLSFNKEVTEAKNTDGKVSFRYFDRDRKIVMTLKENQSTDGISLSNINNYTDDCDKYEIKLVFDVERSANGRLFNSAVITNYGYNGRNGKYYSALNPGVDRDSSYKESEYAQNGIMLTQHHQNNYKQFCDDLEYDMSEFEKKYLQYEDDDDVDVVVVRDSTAIFDLSLRKYISKVQKSYNDNHNQPVIIEYKDRVPEVTFEALCEWWINHTAAYEHQKLKVVTEKGDLVTYKIRIHNEGKEDDYAGRATEITDYVPAGLQVIGLDSESEDDWEIDYEHSDIDSSGETESKVIIKYKGNTILPVDNISDEYMYGEEHGDYQELAVVCKVVADVQSNTDFEEKPLTNRAAITGHQAFELFNGEYIDVKIDEEVDNDGDGIPDGDLDSEPEELTPNLDNWYEKKLTDEQNPPPYIPGEQDDDDFDTIYVRGYTVRVKKTDIEGNILPGMNLDAYTYRAISNRAPETVYPSAPFDSNPDPLNEVSSGAKTEIRTLEQQIYTQGEGDYYTSAPTTVLENDVYILKEIEAPSGYYNPFEGKYIKFSIRGGADRTRMNYRYYQGLAEHYEIYTDDGDDDYTNDELISPNIRDRYNPYNYLKYNYNYEDGAFEIILENRPVESYGKYTVDLYKYGKDERGNYEQLDGVQFEATGTFNGGSQESIPSAGNVVETSKNSAVKVVPNTYTEGYIEIDPDYLDTPDVITLTESGVNPTAVAGDGNLVIDKYYQALQGKIIQLKIYKKKIQEFEKVLYVIDRVETKILDANTLEEVELNNGAEVKVECMALDFLEGFTGNLGPKQTIIAIRVINPIIVPEGSYNINLMKVGLDDIYQELGGIEFNVSAEFNEETYNSAPGSDYSDYTVVTDDRTSVSLVPSNITDGVITIDPTKYTTPDKITLVETGFANTPSGNDAKANYQLSFLNKNIEITINKDVDNTDPMHPVYYVSSIDLSVDGQPASGTDYSKQYNDPDSSAYVKITYNKYSKIILVRVVNEERVPEGSYSVYLTKTGTDGKQLGGVEFDAIGYINNDLVRIPAANTRLVTDATNAVAVMPTGTSEIEIDPDEYQTNDTITLTEKGLAQGATDEDGNPVSDRYYLGFKDKTIVINIKKTVDKTDPVKDIYSVDEISVTLDGQAVPAKDGVANTYEYVNETNGATLTVSLNAQTNRIDIVVSNPTKTHEGDYSINIKKMSTDGRQLGGVEFDTQGHFNGEDYPTATAAGTYTVTTSANSTVDMLPTSLNGVVEIDEDHYTDADVITFEESGYAAGAVDDQGNAVDGNYYLALDGKEFELTINKDVTHEETKDVYYVSSLGLKVNGSTDNVTGAGYSYTYDDPDTDASVTVTYDETTRAISIVATNVPIEREGTYHVKLIKYKQGSNTPVAGVKFIAYDHINGTNETIATNMDPLVTETTAISVRDNVPMSEEQLNDNDTFTVREVDVGTNPDIYIGYTGNIEVEVTKKMDTSDPSKKVFLVDTVTLKINNQAVPGNSITLDNGTKIEVSYNENTKTIEIRVTDPIKEGNFKINLIKYKTVDEDNDGNHDALAGAVFNITVNDGTSDIKTVTNQITNADGEIPTISGINITSENLTYTITVTEVSAPDGYIGIGEPVTFQAKSKFDGSKYVLDTSEQPTIANNYVQAEVHENEIVIEAENRVEPIIHKGVKTVENQNSGYYKNEVQTWVINTTVPTGIGDYTKYVVTDTIDKGIANNADKRIEFLNESNPTSNVVVKYKGTDTRLTEGTDYKVAFDTTTKTLTITFINATDGADNFVGGRALTEETTLEITYNTKFTLDDNGDPIGLNQRIPNMATLTYNGNGSEEKEKKSEEPEVHTGGLGVYKYDKETNLALQGAKFRLVRTEDEAEAAVAALWSEDQTAIDNIDWVRKNSDGTEGDIWEVTTGSDGYAYFAGLEFGKDASDSEANRTNNGKGGSVTYEYEDWDNASTTYYLVETYVPENYVLLETYAAECEVKHNNFAVTDLTTYHRVGNEVVAEEGEYAVEIAKYGKYENEDPQPIEGVIFSAKRTVNGGAEENLGNLTATDSTGRTLVGDTVTIEREHVETNDVYTIHEESIPDESEYYVGLNKDIVLTVSKQSVKSADKKTWLNSVTGINMTIEGETVTPVVDGQKYTATVVKDGQTLTITAELLEDNNGGQYIKLSVENPHKVGTFPLNIIKTVRGTNSAVAVPNAGFKVSIKNGDEFVTTTSGTAIDGTHEYFTDGEGKILIDDIKIARPGLTYDVEIEETTVPEGYIGISGKIQYSVTSTVSGNKLSLAGIDPVTVSNDVKYEVKDGEIWNYVQDKPEPVIHKGVKTVENQDAGYNGDEIQTWVINSTVPAGISDYIKYVITDTIDKNIANNADKRIEFINEEHPENNVVVKYKGTDTVLTAGTDYLVYFDRDTKQLKITFIEGAFVKGRELEEKTVLEITFKTKFRLDADGKIIGLCQRIPNIAELTYGVEGRQEKEKVSEEPEVHTGAVGVIKYEDVNKSNEFDSGDKVLEGAHFKIARSEEDARRAVTAVLAGDTDTLNTINFVKVRDDDGNETSTDVELITNDHGEATYEGLAFGGDASDSESNRSNNGKGGSTVYGYDWQTAKSTYYLVETEAPEEYYLLDKFEPFDVSKNSFVRLDYSKYYKEANKPKIYDLSLRKFITHVNGTDRDGNVIDRNITDREPIVTLTDEFKNGDVTTAEYEHTKEPVIVQQGNIVTYTIRVYNEGPEDAYAAIVKDDIPDGVEFIKYTEGDGSVNDEYDWKLVDENDNPVDDVSKAKYIVTEYLSMEQGKTVNGVNVNLLKGYNKDTMSKLDYRDLKVQFLVTESNKSERIITNYAQIDRMTNGKNKGVDDRDSHPNEWIEGEDDQDVEHIRLLYFDLALRKWVTKAIVISDGEEKVFETGHKAEDNPEDVVKVDLKKSKLDKVIVKFEYQIRITNEGRIGGWADEVTDHIPDGLTFDQADNPIWTVVDDKTVVTDALKDTYLEPGESAEVTIVLRWENSGDNLGIKVNVAEISKDRNPYGVHDIDSTPGNYKWGEDDIDDAPVMLAIKTGNRAIGYAILGLVVVSIVAAGTVAIKKVRKE